MILRCLVCLVAIALAGTACSTPCVPLQDFTPYLLSDAEVDAVLPDPRAQDSWHKGYYRVYDDGIVVNWLRARRAGSWVSEDIALHASAEEASQWLTGAASHLVVVELEGWSPAELDLTGTAVRKVGDEQLAICVEGSANTRCRSWTLMVRVGAVTIRVDWGSNGTHPVAEIAAMADTLATHIPEGALITDTDC